MRKLSTKHKKPAKPRIRFRPELFWDTDVKKLDVDKHPFYVIERILDFGEIKELKWMAHYFPAEKIKDVMRRSRVVSDKSKALWSMVF